VQVPAAVGQPPAQVRLLDVHEEALVEGADPLQGGAADEQRAARRPVHPPRRVPARLVDARLPQRQRRERAARRGREAPRRRLAAAVREHDARRDGTRRGARVELRDQAVDGARLHDRVLVEDDDDQSSSDKSPVVRTLDKKEVEEEVAEALVKLGHEPVMYELDGTQKSLLGLGRIDCDLVFNLAESFADDDTSDFKIAALLELLGK